MILVEHDRLPLSGVEDIDYFQLGADPFLVTGFNSSSNR
jgi:hypothetical protein